MPSSLVYSLATCSGLFHTDVFEQNYVKGRPFYCKCFCICCVAFTAVVIFLFLYSSDCHHRAHGCVDPIAPTELSVPNINDVARTEQVARQSHRQFAKTCITNATGQPVSTPLVPTKPSGNGFTRIIHRTWKTEDVPAKWQEGAESCHALNPSHQYCHWTDAELESFIAIEYPWFLETYHDYTYDIQRVDAARYLLLYHYGGVYVDLDLVCRQSFDEMFSDDADTGPEEIAYDVILVETLPVGVTNEFVAIRQPRDPFMRQVIDGLRSASSIWYLFPYPTIMFSTGPMYLSNCLWSMQENQAAAAAVAVASHVTRVRIIKRPQFDHEYFRHLFGSSWHRWDGRIISFFFLNRYIFLVVGVIVLLIVIIVLLRRFIVYLRRRTNVVTKPYV